MLPAMRCSLSASSSHFACLSCRLASTLPQVQIADVSSRVSSTKASTSKSQCEPRTSRVYGWGLAMSGALGNAQFIHPKNGHEVRTCRTPVRIQPKPGAENELTVCNVAAGHSFTLLVANGGKQLFGTGINSSGQLGFIRNPKHKHLSLHWQWTPYRIQTTNDVLDTKKTPITTIDAGRAHTVFATSAGVFAMGNNAHGQCGRPIDGNEDYGLARHHITRVNWHSMHSDERVVHVACGLEHTLVLSDKGRVYACGLGADSQLGVVVNTKNEINSAFAGERVMRRHECLQVAGDIVNERIVHITTGVDSNFAVNESGAIFGWGNNEYGQLTSDGGTSVDVPTFLPHVSRACKEHGGVKQLASGGSFSMALTANGDVLIWGYGLLGLGPERLDAPYPRRLSRAFFGGIHADERTAKSNIVHIGAGVMHCGAATSDSLYMWGKNHYGQLGTKSMGDHFVPTKVEFSGIGVSRLSLGVDHSIALCRMRYAT